MRLAVVGSRDFPDADERVLAYVGHFRAKVYPFGDVTLISGGARGVDRAAARAANMLGLDIDVLLPDWDKLGRAAGVTRNEFIVRGADQVVAFWDGKSRGTKNSIDWALKLHKRLEVIFP